MQRASVVSLFCEDIREEKSSQYTIIGILPDNVDVQTTPGNFPKLGIYSRVHLDAQQQPKLVVAKLQNLDGSEVNLLTWDEAVVEKAFVDAKANGMPLVGLVLKAVTAPFPMTKAGKIILKIVIDGDEYIGGVLNIISSRATVSAPPVSQSPTASSSKG